MILSRFLEFLPLALVLGATLAALRHERMEAIQHAAVRTTTRIVVTLLLGCLALQGVLWLVQD